MSTVINPGWLQFKRKTKGKEKWEKVNGKGMWKETRKRNGGIGKSIKNLRKSVAYVLWQVFYDTLIFMHSSLNSLIFDRSRAKIDIVSLYSINSLFWMLMKTLGHNPQVQSSLRIFSRHFYQYLNIFTNALMFPVVSSNTSMCTYFNLISINISIFSRYNY